MHKMEKFFILSFIINLIIGQFFLYAWIHYWDIFSVFWVKSVVVFFMVSVVLLLALSAYRYWDPKDWLVYTKVILALIGAFMLPYILFDTYLPPFALLFYGAAVAAVMTYSGFVAIPAGDRIGYAELALGSAYPLIAPILFYILYQLLRMPHLIEIAGLCHVSTFSMIKRNEDIIGRLKSIILGHMRRDISRRIRRMPRWEGLL